MDGSHDNWNDIFQKAELGKVLAKTQKVAGSI